MTFDPEAMCGSAFCTRGLDWGGGGFMDNREGKDLVAPNLTEDLWTFAIEVVEMVKNILGGALEIYHWQDAGVGDEDVDLAKVLDGGVDHGLDTADAACICLDSDGTFAANRFNDLVGSGRVGRVVDHD